MLAFVHGGYWQAIYNLTHAGHLCADLTAYGVATWNIEYRRLGDPDGHWPTPLDDVILALSRLPSLAADYPLDLDRVVLAGHSAGGHLALLAALRAPVRLRAVASLAGVVDLRATDRRGSDNGLARRLLGAAPDEAPDLWDDASPRARLPFGFPYVLVCGTEDVLWEQNRELAEAGAAAGDDIAFLELPGAGHFELVDPQADEWAKVRSLLLDLLSGR